MTVSRDNVQAGNAKPLDDLRTISSTVTQLRKDAREVLSSATGSNRHIPVGIAQQRLYIIRSALATQARNLEGRARFLPSGAGPDGVIDELRTRVEEAAEYVDLAVSVLQQDQGAGPAHMVADAIGIDLRPDPLLASSSADLIEILRKYRVWAGKPSFQVMSKRNGGKPAASTIWAALNGCTLPRLEMVLAIITGCTGDERDRQRFASAWRTMQVDLTGCEQTEQLARREAAPRPRPAGNASARSPEATRRSEGTGTMTSPAQRRASVPKRDAGHDEEGAAWPDGIAMEDWQGSVGA